MSAGGRTRRHRGPEAWNCLALTQRGERVALGPPSEASAIRATESWGCYSVLKSIRRFSLLALHYSEILHSLLLHSIA